MRRRLKRTAGGCLVVFVLVAIVFPFTDIGKTMIGFVRHGFVQQFFFSDQRKYDATSEGNLKAIYTALMLDHDSEGEFPKEGWMDAIQNYLRTTNMAPEEAQKKLVRPDLVPPKPGVFGYAINDAVAGKYKGDIKDPNTILVFESNETKRNAHGDPLTAKGRLAVSVNGSVIRIK